MNFTSLIVVKLQLQVMCPINIIFLSKNIHHMNIVRMSDIFANIKYTLRWHTFIPKGEKYVKFVIAFAKPRYITLRPYSFTSFKGSVSIRTFI